MSPGKKISSLATSKRLVIVLIGNPSKIGIDERSFSLDSIFPFASVNLSKVTVFSIPSGAT